jgi:hypothetical protein
MILEIGIDPATNQVTVEGRSDHKVGLKGGGALRWKCESGKGYKGFTVKFNGDSPFKDGRKEFSATKGTDGGVLLQNDSTKDKEYSYVVTCRKSDGRDRDVDPEIVLWPESQ